MALPDIVERNFTAGLLTDTIGESTSAAGVTIDGVLLKDSGITGSLIASALDLNGQLDQDAALVAAGDGQNIAVTINHATASAEAVDAAATQLTTPRTSGAVVAVKGGTTSLIGDTGGDYVAFQAVHVDGGGSVVHFGLQVDGTSDRALGTADTTAGGATAGTASLLIQTGARSKSDADAGVPTSGQLAVRSGSTDITAAATGGASGDLLLSTGATDCNDAGGTGGASGNVSISTGNAASTLGTSGASGNLLLSTGNSDDGASGDVELRPGTAGGTPGQVLVEDAADSTKKIAIVASSVTAGQTRSLTMADEDVNLAAIGAEDTDGEIVIPILSGIADAGTWTKAVTSGGLRTITRTNGAATESLWVEVPAFNRTTASRGVKPLGATINYSVDTADATDVRAEIWKVTAGANGASPTAAVLFGEADADYDAAHDTAAKRGLDTAAPQLHRMDVLDAGTPAYLAADERLLLRFVVADPGTSVVILRDASLLYAQRLVDLS